eukprot:353412-Chlamydomonas_euryale.AAC.1
MACKSSAAFGKPCSELVCAALDAFGQTPMACKSSAAVGEPCSELVCAALDAFGRTPLACKSSAAIGKPCSELVCAALDAFGRTPMACKSSAAVGEPCSELVCTALNACRQTPVKHTSAPGFTAPTSNAVCAAVETRLHTTAASAADAASCMQGSAVCTCTALALRWRTPRIGTSNASVDAPCWVRSGAVCASLDVRLRSSASSTSAASDVALPAVSVPLCVSCRGRAAPGVACLAVSA